MHKKILLFVISIICILLIGISVTCALLVSLSEPVKNTFTVGKVEITLTETTGDKYALIPGTTVEKDPKITVISESEECWLFVKIDTTDILKNTIDYSLYDGWLPLTGVDGVYYRKVENATVDTEIPILKDNVFTVKDTLDKKQMATITQSQSLVFTAYAIQAVGLDNSHVAWSNIQTNLESN